MSFEDLEKLHDLWLKFINTKNTKEGESWLDAFLARYLTLFCYNEIPPNHDFSFQYKYSGNVLVHQLLADIYELCEVIEKEGASPDVENEISTKYFLKYLLEGRGWKILWTLDKIGFQHLMHLKELILVLISQMPVLLNLPVHPSVIPECLERKANHLELSSCFFKAKRQTKVSKVVDLCKPEIYMPLKRHLRGRKRVRRKRIKQDYDTSSSTSSEERNVIFESCCIPASQMKSLLKVKTGTNNSDASSSDCDESSHFYIGSDTSVATNVSDFNSYSISVLDYIAFNLNIFQECVLLDKKNKDIDVMTCSCLSVLEFSYSLLAEIHTKKYKFSGWPEEAVEDLKHRLVELLFLSLNVARISFGYCEPPTPNEIISTLLLIAEEVLHSKKLVPSKDIIFVSHLLKGCLMLVHNVIETSDGDHAKIICITRTFINSGGNLCLKIFSLLEITVHSEHELKTIIPLVRDIVTTLKILRTSATYNSEYACDIKDYIHHHHDIFGPPINHSVMNKDPMCCVATMCSVLLKFFSISLSPKTSNDILKYLKMSGICCCVEPSFLIKSLFDGFGTRELETQKLVLLVLGKHLFPQLGLVSKCQRRCSSCSKYSSAGEFLSLEKTLNNSISENQVEVSCPKDKTSDYFKSFFKVYYNLFRLDDVEALENVCRHLIEVFTICNTELKIQFFVRIVFPQFLHMSINYNEPIDSAFSIKANCFLSIMPDILSNPSLYHVFLKFEGMPVIFSLLLKTEFRELSLNVIKILIFSEKEYWSNMLPKNYETCTIASRIFFNFLCDHSEVLMGKLSLIFKSASTSTGTLIAEEELKSLKSSDSSLLMAIEDLPENLNLILDTWSLFEELIMNSKLDFSSDLLKKVLISGYNFLLLLIKNLFIVLRIKTIVEDQKTEKMLLLMQSLIFVLINQKEEVHYKKSILDIVKKNLKIHVLQCPSDQKMLFCLMLKCSFRPVTVATPVKRLQEVIYPEEEILDSISSSDKDESEISTNDDSYDGDTEGSDIGSMPTEEKKDRFTCENFIEHGEFVQMLCEFVIDLQKQNTTEWMSAAVYFMQTLTKLCQDCSQNKSVLCSNEIPPLLLDIFSNSLNVSQGNMKEFQSVTMDLFVILAESVMKVNYIRRLIEFFKMPDSPVDILLRTFNKMADQTTDAATWYTTFPCVKRSNTGYVRTKKRFKTIHSTYKQYESAGSTLSAWTSAALFFPLTEDTKWSALNKGFNFTLWLKMNHSSNGCQIACCSRENSLEFLNESYTSMDSSLDSHLLHILSIGSEKILIEFWCGKYFTDLNIRVSSYLDGEISCLAEGKCNLHFQLNKWHHIAVIYNEETEKSITTSKFFISMDGVKEHTCILKYKRTGIKSLNKCYLLLGCSAPVLKKSYPTSYSIANFCLFKDYVLTKEILCYLTSVGPDVIGITNCAIRKPENYILKDEIFHQTVSTSNVSFVTGNNIPNLDPLQNSVLCSYSARNPDIYLVYPPIQRGFFQLHFPGRGKSKLSSFEEWPYQKQPAEFASLSVAAIHSHQYCGFEYAVQNAGGIRIFVFLFANVLEYFASEENLSAALSIILKLLNKSMAFVEDFTRIKGYELLIQMISNNKCCISSEFLEVFIQNCLIYPFSEKNFFLSYQLPEFENLIVIRNTSIFKLMFRSLAFSPQTPPFVMTGLFSVLDILLNPKHSKVQINVEELMSFQLLNLLLWLLKRNYILFEKHYLPSAVMKLIPIIIENLLTYRFNVQVLQNIMCMLLMLHNASSTYVCHSPSSFFFLFPRDKSNSSTVSSNIKTSSLSVDDGVIDASSVCHASEIRRTSSFSGTLTVLGKEKLKKSISVDNVIHDFSSEDKGIETNPIDFRSDTMTKVNEFMFDAKHLRIEINEIKSVELTVGLLKLVHNFIMSDNKSYVQATLEIIKPEIFLVLTYTKNLEICASVIKVISAYLRKSNEEKRNEFLNVKGFHLLANQLYQSTPDTEVVDACFSMIFGSSVFANDLYLVCENMIPSSFQILSWVPVLALLPNTCENEELCEKIISILGKFLHLGTSVIIELLENGLAMSLISLILNCCLTVEIEFDENFFEKHLIIKMIGQLLKYVAEDLCSSKNSKAFTSFIDVLQVFFAWERKCQDSYGPESMCVTCLRNFQCIMFEIVVEFSELYNLTKQESAVTVDEPSLWDVVVGLQGSFGSFSSISVPQTIFQAQEFDAVEAEEFERPLSAEAEKCVNEVPLNDIIDRFIQLIEMIADFFIFKDNNIITGLTEKEFFKNFFKFVIDSLTPTLDKQFKIMKSKNSSVLFALKDTLKKQLGRILVSSFAPSQDNSIKTCVAEILIGHPYVVKLLQLAMYSVAKVGAFLIFLYDLQAGPLSKFQKQYFLLFTIVKQLLENSSYITLLYDRDSMENVKKSWFNLWNEDRYKWLSICYKKTEKTFQKVEFLAQDVSTMALYVTQQVFEIQNMERKLLIEEVKTKYYDEACERMLWLELCEQMTHERAVWHIKEYYPFSWEIDPTEGPGRIRKRLKRCHINMHPRFFQPEHAEALMTLKKGTPFVNLLLQQNEYPDSAVVLHRLFRDEQIKFTCPCLIVTAFEEIAVEILIGAYCIHIIGENTTSQCTRGPISESWTFESIKEIIPRRHELLNNAFEIFLTNGITYMIAFHSEKDFNMVWKQLENQGLPCEANKDPLLLTQLWRDGSITNYEYLIQLNKLAGRTFNDLMQYPVFPFILADYVSFFLNLKDPASFRNLHKPIAVQSPKKEEYYRTMYRMLSEQAEFDSSLPYIGPYHYGSHYSNSGTVLHFLIRLLPYTYGFISYQDRNFDCADRTFHNLSTSWDLVTEKSSSDVKEFIPEFFFLPEFLCNRNGFDFGITQAGIRVNDVILPPWSKQNARLFILIHRQALESEIVTNNLHGWIDLIFGYKQTGEAAINAVNVFHPSTYFGMDRNQYSDPVKRDAFRTMIRTLGNTPQQLFFNPHPMVSLTLAALDLIDEKESHVEVLDCVQGLRWGNYVGSPTTGVPSLVWCRKQTTVLGSFLPLLTNYVFGLGKNVCLLLNHKKDTGSGISRATFIMSAALVSWNHKDGIVRIKLCRDQPSLPLLSGSNTDPICLCASVPDCRHLFVAHSSGTITVYNLDLNASELVIKEKQPSIQLNGHSAAITSICICKAFSIVASASLDMTVIIWDLNRLCYVRTLSCSEGAVTLVCVSDTLGDVASVCSVDNYAGSVLKVHTINGDVVGTVQLNETITAICYSTAPEGLSINVIATGLSDGAIRLWSSWDLKLVRVIASDRFPIPIQCLSFSADNQHLYASNEDGTVTVWEKPSRGLTSFLQIIANALCAPLPFTNALYARPLSYTKATCVLELSIPTVECFDGLVAVQLPATNRPKLSTVVSTVLEHRLLV